MKNTWIIVLVIVAVLLMMNGEKKEAGPYETNNLCSPSSSTKVYGDWYSGQTISTLPFTANLIELGITREIGTNPGDVILTLEEVDQVTGFPNGNQLNQFRLINMPEGGSTHIFPVFGWDFEYGKVYALILKAPDADLANALTVQLCGNSNPEGEHVRWATNTWEGWATQDIPIKITGTTSNYHSFLWGTDSYIAGASNIGDLMVAGQPWIQ